jgi:bacillithiol biosynthesis cysteine-adding enzyme BshC
MSRAFGPSYAVGDPRATAIFADAFRNPESRARVTRDAARRGCSPVIVSQLVGSPTAKAKLGRAGAAAVVTGQQVGLFLGPLYSFYKAATAVVVARTLEAETGVPCVPVFWLQTEDHDFAEIATCRLPRAGQPPVSITLGDNGSDERVSVAHRVLGADLQAAWSTLRQELDRLPFAGETMGLLEAHYVAGRTWPDAFAGLLLALFAEDGLVALNPRAEPVARTLVGTYAKALQRSDALTAALESRGTVLRAAGFDEQVDVRSGACLLFFHPKGPTGPRFRVERRAHGRWGLAGCAGEWSEPELHQCLETEPIRFSTSSLLRPIVQDVVLPTAAYIGGPGELSYFPQVAAVYPEFEQLPPLIVPRARFRCLDVRTRALLKRFGLTAAAVEDNPAALLDLLARRPPGLSSPQEMEGALGRAWASVLDSAAPGLAALNPQLSRAVERTRATAGRAASRLAGRYRAALGEHDRVATARAERLRAFLLPEGIPQERAFGLPWFLARFGVRAFKQAVFSSLSPFDGTVKDVLP